MQSLTFNDRTARPRSLTIGGLTVLGGDGTQPYGVPIESIEVTEAGPGQVSAMTFTLDDPGAALTLFAGSVVRFWDNRAGHDYPIFTGFVDTWESSPLGIGRSIAVSCVGIECLLDWLYVPTAIDFGAPASLLSMILGAIGTAVGPSYPLWAAGSAAGTSTQAVPIGLNTVSQVSGAGKAGPGTLRKVLQTIADAIRPSGTVNVMQVHVDQWGGLRIWTIDSATPGVPAADLTGFAVTAAGYPANVGTDLHHRTSPGDATRTCVVTDSTGTTTVVVSDGSGVPGRTTAVTAPVGMSSVSDLQAFGAQVLARLGATVGGDVTLSETTFTLGTNGTQRAGAGITITDAQAGVAGASGQVSQIVKSFLPSGQEQWQVTYGATRSGVQALRSLTAAVVQ